MVGYYDPVSSEEIKMANGNGVGKLRWPVRDTFVPQNIRAFIETVNQTQFYDEMHHTQRSLTLRMTILRETNPNPNTIPKPKET